MVLISSITLSGTQMRFKSSVVSFKKRTKDLLCVYRHSNSSELEVVQCDCDVRKTLRYCSISMTNYDR